MVLYLGLPALVPKPGKRQWKSWWVEMFMPLKDLFRRKNMALLLLSYTVYTDTVFAVSSITSQLFFVEIKPDALEISLYSLANSFVWGRDRHRLLPSARLAAALQPRVLADHRILHDLDRSCLGLYRPLRCRTFWLQGEASFLPSKLST